MVKYLLDQRTGANQSSNKGFDMSSNEKKVVLSQMTKRSLKDFNKTEAQGWIINTSIKIEDLIDDILLAFFKPNHRDIFMNYCLNSSIMHYGGKLKVLRVIGIDNSTYSSLQYIGSIRNAFAHANISHTMTVTFDSKSMTKTQVDDNIRVMNSQGEIKSKDPYNFMVEFLELYKKVEPVLKQIRSDMDKSQESADSKV